MLLASHCPVCRTAGPAPCRRCISELRSPPSLPLPLGVDAAVALFAYDGVGATMITRLKYANHRDALVTLAGALAEAARVDGPYDLVTWVPTTADRRAKRGFDQAELLARTVGRRLGVAVRATLRRTDLGHQTGRVRSERAAVSFDPRRSVGESVLVVDDVRTSGASLAAAASALRQGGAVRVCGATLAATR